MSAQPAGRRWVVAFVLLAAVWGSSFLFMRTAALQFGTLPTAGVRVAVAALFLLPWLLWRGEWATVRRHWRALLWVGLFNSAIPFACYAHALPSVTTGLTAILNATSPMFGALVAWLWLGERPDRGRAAGMLLGLFGVALLAGDSAGARTGTSTTALAGAVAACLVATLSYGIAANQSKQWLAGVSPLAISTGSLIGASVLLAPLALWTWPASPPDLHGWLAVTAAGVLCTGLAFIVYFRLIEQAGPARALSVTFLIPVFALLFGAVLLGEPITPWTLLSGAVIVLGTALATGVLRRR